MRGSQYGDWILKKCLGEGGNAFVWEAINSNGSMAAIKLFKPRLKADGELDEKHYQRFRDEVNVMDRIGLTGVMKIMEKSVPDDLTTSDAWYAMPVGVPLIEYVRELRLEIKLQLILDLSDALVKLHKMDIAHRDIKPGNVIVVDGSPCFADFGLAWFSENSDVTAEGDRVGAVWTIAPEAKRANVQDDQWLPCDVYSFAKTVWMVLTGDEKGFDGQYIKSEPHGLSNHLNDMHIDSLETLLSDSTSSAPDSRPSAEQFHTRLVVWFRGLKQYAIVNAEQWSHTIRRLFPVTIPLRASWQSIDDILTVLNLLADKSDLCHMFLPDGGGMDIEGARLSTIEEGCIEIDVGGIFHLMSPDRLCFESFDGPDEWYYFRLEATSINPSGVYGSDNSGVEELVYAADHGYIARHFWEEKEYQGKPLDPNSRIVIRFYSGGAWVIFRKTSTYNWTPGTYDARHNKVSGDRFRSHIENVVSSLNARDLD